MQYVQCVYLFSVIFALIDQLLLYLFLLFFFFQAEDGIRDIGVTGVQTCALPICISGGYAWAFPKGDCWNVGVVTVRRETGPRLRALLSAFVDTAGIEFAHPERSEERRVGKECRSRCAGYHYENKEDRDGRVVCLG